MPFRLPPRFRARARAALFLLLAVTGLSLTGCGIATTADWRRCSFHVNDIEFLGLRENQTDWRIHVSAVNPGAKKLRVDGLHLWALMEGDTLARLKNPGRVELGARDTTGLSFDVTLPQVAWSKALRSMRRTGSAEILLTGDVAVPTLFGSRLVKNAVREKHTIDLSSVMGGAGGMGGLGAGLMDLFFR